MSFLHNKQQQIMQNKPIAVNWKCFTEPGVFIDASLVVSHIVLIKPRKELPHRGFFLVSRLVFTCVSLWDASHWLITQWDNFSDDCV